MAVFVKAGHVVRLVNTPGTQTVDTWCIAARDMTEYLSVEHTRRMLSRLFPRAGQEADCTPEGPQLADQRPICSSKPASQCDEPRTVGIRQISTADGLTSTADIGSPRAVMTGSYAATNSSS